MAGLIPQAFIDDLVARADIVEIINARVPLKRKGKEYMACCPFHNEKTPSFTVSESKQFYHCFGCGAHGTALGFLMQYDNLEFIDAVEELAAMYHLEVPREQGTQHRQDDREPLLEALAQANLAYQQALKTSPQAVDYLKQRGLTGEIAKHYQIGFAPAGWDFLTAKNSANSEQTKALVKTGMLFEKDSGGHYDRFRERIMFPITNRRGRIIGFGGRILDNNKDDAKYLNSPENTLFHKGQEVYGLYEAKRASRELKRIIVVEGYMDVVALAQFGISYAVACLGTATTREQIQLIYRSVGEIIYCYDGDNAGRKAAWRACQNTLEVIRDGQQARFLFMPEGEDPDSLVRKEGREAFEQRLDEASPLSDFLFDQLQQESDIAIPEGKAKLAGEATPLLNRMQDSMLKDLLFDRLAELSGVRIERLQQPADSGRKPTPPAASPTGAAKPPTVKGLRNALALLLQDPDLATSHELDSSLAGSEIHGVALLYELYLAAREHPGIRVAALLERFREHPDFVHLSKLLHYDIPGSQEDSTRRQLYLDSIASMTREIGASEREARRQALENRVSLEGVAALSAAEKQEYIQLISADAAKHKDS